MAYCEANHWLQATWQGVVNTPDGQYAAAEVRRLLQLTHIPYLLNDNSQVRGPWFDSVDWLEHLWVPRAELPGLRYVAHVVQPHIGDGLGQRLRHDLFAGKFELQFFSTWAEAAGWLRECQLRDNRHFAQLWSNAA